MILVYSITPVHVGAGRSAGVVDLPIQRDALGYPVIFSSSFKGALKAFCGGDSITNDGRIDCSKAKLCCCAFGSEPLGSDKETGILTLTDLIPFAVPVPAGDDVYLYLTSPYLLRKIKDLLEAEISKTQDNTKKEELSAFHNSISTILNTLKGNSEKNQQDMKEIFIGDKVRKIEIKDEKTLELLKGLGTLASDIKDKLVVKESGDDRYLFDKATLKISRNRIVLSTKTVKEGALWTEEYLPEGTIFVGGYFTSNRRNSYCGSTEKVVDELKRERFSNGTFYLNLGGKESIGKGLVKISWW